MRQLAQRTTSTEELPTSETKEWRLVGQRRRPEHARPAWFIQASDSEFSEIPAFQRSEVAPFGAAVWRRFVAVFC